MKPNDYAAACEYILPMLIDVGGCDCMECECSRRLRALAAALRDAQPQTVRVVSDVETRDSYSSCTNSYVPTGAVIMVLP